MSDARAKLSLYNCMIRENDELYRSAVKAVGLSDCAFWILYHLRDVGQPVTQRDICAAIYAPKQTVNSALKRLEQEGFLALTAGSDRRSKLVCLTDRGNTLAARTIDRVFAAELEAMDALSDREQEEFLALFRKLTDLLQAKLPHSEP